MIVGTAGHIDHGKTTLTRALTGVDTDRLKEEKERGISIELGYAYTALPNGEMLGVVDVPGHEKLIHTMAAGASGIDYALLVIAADDGVMPQTREHLDILRLLGVRRGAVVLSKRDKLEQAGRNRRVALEAEIAALLAGSDFASDGVFATAAQVPGDSGVAQLLAHLTRVAQDFPARRDGRLFRLAIDRVFTLAGHGTVVAGTALSGSVSIGDELCIAPAAITVKVRSIRAQNQPARQGWAGQRLALSLPGVAREQIARGDWLVAPSLAECSPRLDAEVRLLAHADVTLKPWSSVHVHLGAAHLLARVALLEGDALQPGAAARVQLVFDKDVHAVPGERFLIRNAQGARTIGGGRVLDPFGPARKRRSAARLAWLEALAQHLERKELEPLWDASPLGMRRSLLSRLTLWPAHALPLPPDVVEIALPGGDAVLISKDALQQLCRRALEALARFHQDWPDETGPQQTRLQRMLDPKMEAALWYAVLERLSTSAQIARQGSWLHLPSHTVQVREDEQALAGALLQAMLEGGYDPPWVRDLSARLQAPEQQVRDLLCKLARLGQSYQVVRDLFYHPRRIAELAQLLHRLAGADKADREDGGAGDCGRVSVAHFRDACGLGRKRAVQLMEFFDRVGYTRRWRDDHLLRSSQAWTEQT